MNRCPLLIVLVLLAALLFIGKNELGLVSEERVMMITKLIGVGVLYILCFAGMNWKQVGFLRGEIKNFTGKDNAKE